MNFILTIFSFPPILLLINSIALATLSKFYGIWGAFYSSLFIFIAIILLLIAHFYFLLASGGVVILDFGRWFSCLSLFDSHISLILDPLSLIGSLVVSILTPLALYFGSEYMFREGFVFKLTTLLNLFAFSVISLFHSYDFFLIVLSWEGIGLFSLLLVNFYSIRVYTIKAALKTFLFSRLSDMFLFLSLVLIIFFFQTLDLSLIFIQIPFLSFNFLFFGNYALHLLTLLSFCISMAGLIKSAQFFFHVWLPDAMEAPTPASALIHSSTLVVAGIFLMLRFSLLFEFSPSVSSFLAIWGSLTLVFASITACFQQDLKKLVAYSTISQIGYLVCGCGFLAYEETLIYLIIHALNKATLFILVGYIVHFFNGNTDLRFMGSSWFVFPDIGVMLMLLSFNLAGSPYFSGFIGKEFLIANFFGNGALNNLIAVFWFISFLFTPVYMLMPLRFIIFGNRKLSPFSVKSLRSKLTFTDKFRKDPSFQLTFVNNLASIYIFPFFLLFIIFSGEFFTLLLMSGNDIASLFSINSLRDGGETESLASMSSALLSQALLFFIKLSTLTSLLIVNSANRKSHLWFIIISALIII